MTAVEIQAKSILRRHKRIDSWFLSRYGMNLYRGCRHDCVYCDGRAERYYVEGVFGKDITVKLNAIDILRRELDPTRKRKPLKKGFVIVGGGVGDSYQPLERKYQLTRRALELFYEYDRPVHMLTKSTLIKRDLDLLKKINQKSRAIVSFSFSSMDDEISGIFEPGVPAPSERLDIIRYFKDEGISCGMFLLPVIPHLTDSREMMDDSIKKAKEAGVDFIIFGGMTLKDGRQKEHFMKVLGNKYNELIPEYQKLYKGNEWGQASVDYYNKLNLLFNGLANKYDMPKRIPLALYKDILDENDLVTVILEHVDYILKLERRRSPYGYAANSISRLDEPLSSIKGELQKISGVGQITEEIILEILETGSSKYYEKLMNGSEK